MNRLELTVRIFREIGIVQERTDFFLKRDLPPDLPAVQYRLLNHLLYTTNVDETVGDLARNSLVSLSAMSQIVRQLVNKGYVALETPPDDARRKVVRVTERGRAAHQAALAAIDEDFRPLAGKLALGDLEQLFTLLQRFRQAFERLPAGSVVEEAK